MKNLISKINKRENTIMVICILIIFACIFFFFYIFSKEKEENRFNYAANLDEPVLTIFSDKEELYTIPLKEFSYYIIVAEAVTQKQALFFGENTPANYWELKVAPLQNLRSETKKFCVAACVRDNLLYDKALESNLTLTDKENNYLKDTSYEIYTSLTAEQVGVTQIELSDIFNVQKKIFLGEKYILSLIENETITERNDISSDGEYYLNKIKSQYNIEENDSILENLVFGSITVNLKNKE